MVFFHDSYGTPYIYGGVYIPPQENGNMKKECYDRLSNNLSTAMTELGWLPETTRIILSGDYNTKLDAPKTQPDFRACDRLRQLMEDFHLIDTWRTLYPDSEQHPGMTYVPHRYNHSTSRLDYILISRTIINLSDKNSRAMNHLTRSGFDTDHIPIELRILTEIRKKRTKRDSRHTVTPTSLNTTNNGSLLVMNT